MKDSTNVTVYLDGVKHQITLKKLKSKGWNMIRHRSNGYSHDWSEICVFEESRIQNINGVLTVWCTIKPLGIVQGSSQVSFS